MVQQPPGPPPGGMQMPPPPPGPPGMPPQAPVARPRPQLDMSNLPVAEIVVVVCALILVIMSGIGWYKSEIKGLKGGDYDILYDYDYGDKDLSLTDFYELGLGGGAMSVLTMIVGILLLVFALVMLANQFFDFLPMQLPTGLIYLGGVALILLFMVLGIFVKPGLSVGGIGIGDYWSEFTGEELGKAALSWAMWIVSLVFALGIGVGGVMKIGESK